MNEVERATEVPEKLEKNTHSSFEKRSFNLNTINWVRKTRKDLYNKRVNNEYFNM